MAEKVDRYSTPLTSAPPQYEIGSPCTEIGSPHYELQITQYEVQSVMAEITAEKPIVVPQSTNLFFIKTFSPFTRCYPLALAKLQHPILREEFLAFIDRLNQVFISNPIFQAVHVIGGMLMGSQILSAMAVGCILQFGSVMVSAGVSFVRIQTTKKMMAQVGFTDTDAKGKLKLHPLEVAEDLDAYNPMVAIEDRSDGIKAEKPLEKDPRLLRLKALEGYIVPLEFEVAANPTNEGRLSKMGQAPLRWMNKKQMKKLDTAKAKSLKKPEKYSAEVEAEEAKAQKEIAELDRRMEGLTEEERSEMEMAKKLGLEKRGVVIANIYKGADKKVNKVYRKEGKVTNRILWIVIHMADGTDGGSLFRVGITATV